MSIIVVIFIQQKSYATPYLKSESIFM